MTIGYVEDAIFNIASYFDSVTLGRCARVNTSWYKVTSLDLLWKNVFPQNIEYIPKENIRKFMVENGASSLKMVIKQFEVFNSSIERDSLCCFTCYFPFNPEITFIVKLGVGNINKNRIDRHKICVFSLPYNKKTLELDYFSYEDSEKLTYQFSTLKFPVVKELRCYIPDMQQRQISKLQNNDLFSQFMKWIGLYV